MAEWISQRAGNWSDDSGSGPWRGGSNPGSGVPASGDTVIIRHAVGVDANTTVGTTPTQNSTGTGTLQFTGATSISGSGTAFLTELSVGDLVTSSGHTRTVLTITNDTTATHGSTVSTSLAAFTIRKKAIYIDTASGILTVAANITLTVLGDLNIRMGQLILSAGSTLVMGANGSDVYYIRQGAGEMVSSGRIVANGTANSRVTIKSATGAGKAQLTEGWHASYIDLTYTDLIDLGDATNNNSVSAGASGARLRLDHCRFYRVGQITNPAIVHHAGADIIINANEVVELPASIVGNSHYQLALNMNNTGTVTGQRLMTNNVFALPDQNVQIVISIGHDAFTITGNIFQAFGVDNGTGTTWTDFSKNLWIKRKSSGGTEWSFVGTGGDTLSTCYFLQDEGPSQNDNRLLMPNDTPNKTGTWKLTDYIVDRPDPTASASYEDLVHIGAPSVAFTMWLNRMIVLPNASGTSSGCPRARSNANGNHRITHCTLMGDHIAVGGAGFRAGISYNGHAGMIDEFRNNLIWHKALPGGATGYAAIDAAAAVDNVADSSETDYNAHYNVKTGTVYEAGGANGTSLLGYSNFRNTVKLTASHDISLGTGTNEITQGPRFVDSTRNFYRFDTDYLDNTATAWANSTAYAVGDIVSASDASFYNGATINYRCILAHTSSSGHATNGKPGVAASFRTNWEPASAYRIREAVKAGTTITDTDLSLTNASYIETLHAWVKAGFSPRNTALLAAGSDGDDIGAVDVTVPLAGSTSTFKFNLAISM